MINVQILLSIIQYLSLFVQLVRIAVLFVFKYVAVHILKALV